MNRLTRWFTTPRGARVSDVRILVRSACLDAGISSTGPEAERILRTLEWKNEGGRLRFAVTAPLGVVDRLARHF